MKKKLLMTISVIGAAVILGVGIYHSDASQVGPQLSEQDISQMVTDQYPGTIEHIELKKGFNNDVYYVQVVSEGKKYELQLDQNSGEVLKLEDNGLVKEDKVAVEIKEKKEASNDQSENKVDNKKQVEKKEKSAAEKKPENKPEKKDKELAKKEPAKKTVINTQKAIDIALNEFSGHVTDIELDEEDGRLIYEIEIESGEDEAEFEIDAYTGEILMIDIDLDDDYND